MLYRIIESSVGKPPTINYSYVPIEYLQGPLFLKSVVVLFVVVLLLLLFAEKYSASKANGQRYASQIEERFSERYLRYRRNLLVEMSQVEYQVSII